MCADILRLDKKERNEYYYKYPDAFDRIYDLRVEQGDET